jgi:polysaccharide export outer membrane protein
MQALLIAVLVGGLAGCASSRSNVEPPLAASSPGVTAVGNAPRAAGPGPAAADVTGTSAARTPRGANAAVVGPGNPGNAGLNSRLLSRASSLPTDADLPLGGGDLVEVSVFEVEELSKLKVRVSRRGTIALPLVGSLTAAGRTATDLEQDIRERLQQKYMHHPQVSVFVLEQVSQRIAILGAVRKGGVQTMHGRLRLADALALAEGLADDADHNVYLVRRVPAGTVVRAQAGVPVDRQGEAGVETEEVMVRIDLDALADGREELNVALQPGDVVHVPRAGSIYVGGSVERPGTFLLKRRTTVEQAIVAAGGVKDVAELEDVRIYRELPGGDRQVLPFSYAAFEKGQPGPELQPNDVVIVGKSASKAFWYGVRDFFQGVFGISKGL